MDPVSLGVGAAGQLISTGANLYGAAQERKMRKKAAELAQKGVGELQGGRGYEFEKALSALGLTDQSAYGSMDPEARTASMQALQNLLQRGSGSGLDVQSRQALAEATQRSGAAQNAARQAVMQEYLQRSSGGSGAELAAMLGGQQANYSQLAGATGQAAAAAEQRRLEANVLASRAGQQQQQLEQQKAAALDALQRFNVGARQNALELERNYRSGAAGQYLGAGQLMAGQAVPHGASFERTGKALGGLLTGGYQLGKDAGLWGGGESDGGWAPSPDTSSQYGNYVQQKQDPYSYGLTQGQQRTNVPMDNQRPYEWNPSGGAW